MTKHSAEHGIFTIARRIDAPVALVFKAWADKSHKARWFKGPDGWTEEIREQDFRVGGNDRLKGIHPGGRQSDFLAQYRDIVPNARIVYVYDMMLNGAKISTSLATVEFARDGDGTNLTVTEQGVFFDGYQDNGSREHGTGVLMDRLAESLSEN
jgi:uncharacterized protein YndB with AHSA1/START domain